MPEHTDKDLVRLIEYWIVYSNNRQGNSLEGFAAWLYKQESLINEQRVGKKNIGLQIMELSDILQRSVNAPIRYREYRVLEVIAANPSSNKLAVIQESGFSQSVGFYTIKLLLDGRYISQSVDKYDGRAKIINLTARGRDVLQQTQAMFKGGVTPSNIFESSKDEQEFYKVLQKISSFERKSKSPKRV